MLLQADAEITQVADMMNHDDHLYEHYNDRYDNDDDQCDHHDLPYDHDDDECCDVYQSLAIKIWTAYGIDLYNRDNDHNDDYGWKINCDKHDDFADTFHINPQLQLHVAQQDKVGMVVMMIIVMMMVMMMVPIIMVTIMMVIIATMMVTIITIINSR